MAPARADALPGRATARATAGRREALGLPASAYASAPYWSVSSIGAGARLGEPSDSEAYRRSIARSLESGVNFLDASINHRFQASERDIGEALRAAVDSGAAARDEVVLCTKGGYLALDCEDGIDNPRKYLSDHYLKTGIVDSDEVANGCHCLAPSFIDDQFERSRRNLGVEAIDIYLLDCPDEQLADVPRPEALRRIRGAFAVLEEKVRAGTLTAYGVATTAGFAAGTEEPRRLKLSELLDAAEKGGGSGHRFRVLELPVSLAAPWAFTGPCEPDRFGEATLLEAASGAGLMVVAASPLGGGGLAAGLPPVLHPLFPGCGTDAQRALQHARSLPGVACAVAGTRSADHAAENAALLSMPKASAAMLAKLAEALGGGA